MKPSLGFLAFVSITIVSHPSARAVDFFWDGTDTTANADGGTGTWDAGSSTNWDDLAIGGGSLAWPSSSSGNDDAFFAGTAGTVTISGSVAANSLTFNSANYVIAGGSLNLDGTAPSITNGSAASISSNLVGTAGLNKIGNGTLTLSGDNSNISGALVLSGATTGNSGGIVANSANALAGFTSIDIQNGSFLQLQGLTLSSSVPITIAGGGGFSAPLGAIRGAAGASVVNGTVTIGDGAVRVGNSGTSLTFAGAVTAATSSGFGLLIRQAGNQGVIFTNTGNYWEGNTVIADGSVYFQPGTLPSTTNLQNAGSGNTWFESNGSFTRAVGTGAGQVQFNATASRINGFSARGGDLTVNLGGASGALTWGSGGFVPGVLGLAGSNATGTLTWQNPINLNAAARTVDVANGSAAVDAEMTAIISGTGASQFRKSGTGTLLLTAANSHAGGTVIVGVSGQTNALRISHANALGTGSLTIGGAGNSEQARLEVTGGITVTNTVASMASRNNTTPSILNVSGNNTITSNLSSGGGGSNITFQSDAGQLSLSGSLAVRNPNFAGAGNILASGNINSPTGYRSLTKSGSGTLILAGASNVTATTTTISGGTLQIGNAGTSGSLGSAAVSNNASLAFDRTDSVTVPNAISGSGQLIQRGTGTLEITGDSNTYTGGTTVSAGTLLVNNSTNSGLGTGQVTVNGGTLGGTGSFTGALVINTTGVLSPGASIASLDTGALTLNSGSTFDYELNTTAVTGDLLNANGNLDLNGLVTLSLTDLGTNSVLSNGTKFTLISYFGSWTSGDIFSGYADDSDFTLFGNEWRINYDDVSAGSVNGGAFSNAVTLTVIPEPAAALLGGLGLLSLLRRRR